MTVLAVIERYEDKHGSSPTSKEIAGELKMSKSKIYSSLRHLMSIDLVEQRKGHDIHRHVIYATITLLY